MKIYRHGGEQAFPGLDARLGSAGLRLRVGLNLPRRNLFNQAFRWLKSPEKDLFLRGFRAAFDGTAQTSASLKGGDFRV